ncbi:hypothetical protein EDB81DRAFT_921206 [Dactylonectria macrodidyma]|uniref:JmjC domain-containing protein n=1 Tax=Dactylonectria macrodidyma TaxID=307937 RepID=A0A9P9D872_9HYPO|nr:hypothetical protein EDB81DRAFT_921206 [Dactylonectria macrodidyma]
MASRTGFPVGIADSGSSLKRRFSAPRVSSIQGRCGTAHIRTPTRAIMLLYLGKVVSAVVHRILIRVSTKNRSRHEISNRHIACLTTSQIPPRSGYETTHGPLTALAEAFRKCQQGSHELYQGKDCEATISAVESFLEIHLGPLGPLAKAFRKEIIKAGGFTDFCSWQEISNQDSSGFTPVIFPDEECWTNPNDNGLLNEILQSFDQNRDKVYSVGAPHKPDEVANLYDVIEQLYEPNVRCPKYAVNLASETAIRKPERFIHHKTDPHVTLTTTTNITPQYARVDVHADRGYHVISILRKNGIKLWGFYPPTKQNLELYRQHRVSDSIFIQHHNEFQGGKFCVQQHGEAMYIPPGYLHITYTVKGGILPGTQYLTQDCLSVASHLLEIDRSTCGLSDGDCQPLLETIYLNLQSNEPSNQNEAMEVFCEWTSKDKKFKQSKLSIHKTVKDKLRSMGLNCTRCKKPGVNH